jgi:hypothetical protein
MDQVHALHRQGQLPAQVILDNLSVWWEDIRVAVHPLIYFLHDIYHALTWQAIPEPLRHLGMNFWEQVREVAEQHHATDLLQDILSLLVDLDIDEISAYRLVGIIKTYLQRMLSENRTADEHRWAHQVARDVEVATGIQRISLHSGTEADLLGQFHLLHSTHPAEIDRRLLRGLELDLKITTALTADERTQLVQAILDARAGRRSAQDVGLLALTLIEAAFQRGYGNGAESRYESPALEVLVRALRRALHLPYSDTQIPMPALLAEIRDHVVFVWGPIISDDINDFHKKGKVPIEISLQPLYLQHFSALVHPYLYALHDIYHGIVWGRVPSQIRHGMTGAYDAARRIAEDLGMKNHVQRLLHDLVEPPTLDFSLMWGLIWLSWQTVRRQIPGAEAFENLVGPALAKQPGAEPFHALWSRR